MDKNAIRKFAISARRDLIDRVRQRAERFGISEDAPIDERAQAFHGRVMTGAEPAQRRALITRIKKDGYQQVMEEAAYTWFNRFIALRFMEVNGYLPSRVRVFSDESGAFNPQLLTEALHVDLYGLDIEKVFALEEANAKEELFKYLLITQCNDLGRMLPGLFEKIADYTELLFPDNLLREGSVIEQMVTTIPEEDWKDAVQIIGWLYQYYNAEPKDKVFADLKKNIKISKEKIPAATQLFTPDWIVRYMVENSLGRLWIEHLRAVEDSGTLDLSAHNVEASLSDDGILSIGSIGEFAIKDNWKYYLDEAPQEPEVEAQLKEIRAQYAQLDPAQILCCDPCMGSGHILVYMFDVLMQIYLSCGWTTNEAVESIVRNNLWGMDIDDRAAQLAYFAVMMKAQQYDNRWLAKQLRRSAQPNVFALQDSPEVGEQLLSLLGDQRDVAERVLDAFQEAKEYGSIIQPNVTVEELNALSERLDAVLRDSETQRADVQADARALFDALWPQIRQCRALVQKYDNVATNPPYMSSSGMDKKLLDYVKNNYDDGRNDLYTVFILRCIECVKEDRFVAMITQQGWLGLTRSAQLRGVVYSKTTYTNMLHLGAKAFEEIGGEVVQSAAFVLSKNLLMDYKSSYCKLTDYSSSAEKETSFISRTNMFLASSRETQAIAGYPLSYWLPRTMLQLFLNSTVGEYFDCRCGMATGDNGRFIRFWHEPDKKKLTHFTEGSKWALYNKGGAQRRWYGNYDLVVNWENNGFDIKENKRKRLERGEIEKKNSECWNSEYYFREGITWSAIASGAPMFRYDPTESLFDTKGPTCFCSNNTSQNEMLCLMGYLNSKVAESVLSVLAPTLDCNPGIVAKLPYRACENNPSIIMYVKKSIELSKIDWDSFETSWDFRIHPLIRNRIMNGFFKIDDEGQYTEPVSYTVRDAFEIWKEECELRFQKLKANEEELNRIFIDIYSLQDELTPEVEDRDVTVRRADLGRDIRSLISYAVGNY